MQLTAQQISFLQDPAYLNQTAVVSAPSITALRGKLNAKLDEIMPESKMPPDQNAPDRYAQLSKVHYFSKLELGLEAADQQIQTALNNDEEAFSIFKDVKAYNEKIDLYGQLVRNEFTGHAMNPKEPDFRMEKRNARKALLDAMIQSGDFPDFQAEEAIRTMERSIRDCAKNTYGLKSLEPKMH